MARWQHATWKPLPEFDNQPRMRATQHISHVTASTGPISGTWKYFASPDVGLESHFGIDYGTAYGGNNDIWQAIDTSRSADANYKANLRPDGTGAISVETRGGEFGTWTPWQIDVLVSNGAWAHSVHGIPLRVCRDPDDPGFGFHTLFGAPSAWTPISKTCPGPNRKPQWRDEVFPRIVAVANGREPDPLEEDVTPEENWGYDINDIVLNRDLNAWEQLRAARADAYNAAQGVKRIEEKLAAGGGGAPIDYNLLADKVADELAARLGQDAPSG